MHKGVILNEDTCDIYADVDFGNGPVKVRCTKTGPHDMHMCEVFIYDDTSSKMVDTEPTVHNIFDNTTDEHISSI